MTRDPTEPHPGDAAHRVICQQVVELLGDYLDEALDPPVRRDVEAHLEACPPCRTFLDQMLTTITLTGHLPAPDALAPDLLDAVVAEFADEFADELVNSRAPEGEPPRP